MSRKLSLETLERLAAMDDKSKAAALAALAEASRMPARPKKPVQPAHPVRNVAEEMEAAVDDLQRYPPGSPKWTEAHKKHQGLLREQQAQHAENKLREAIRGQIIGGGVPDGTALAGLARRVEYKGSVHALVQEVWDEVHSPAPSEPEGDAGVFSVDDLFEVDDE